MTSTVKFVNYVKDRLGLVPELKFEKVGSDYKLSSKGICFGAIIEDMFLVKITKRSKLMIPYASEISLKDNSTMLKMDELGNKIVLKELVQAIVDDIIANN